MTAKESQYSDDIDTSSNLIENTVKGIIGEAVVTSLVAGEMIFCLPIESVAAFGDLFNTLQEKAGALGIYIYVHINICVYTCLCI
jgi:hypothetical protein